MYEFKWAGIVYGRSYHLDFRLIAIPEDFTSEETNWALEHIIPTTRAASKLARHPRWSLFKNESRCIIGVTCMVRDLIQENNRSRADNLTKDAQGRPLYIFVGYSTKINHHRYALRFPTCEVDNLAMFQPLYRHIEERWSIKDSDFNSKKTTFTNYQKLSFRKIKPKIDTMGELARQLNDRYKYPGKVFLWQNLADLNKKLWATTAVCQRPTSLCLGLNNPQNLLQSPFLNGTVTNLSEFTIKDRLTYGIEAQEKTVKPLSQAKFLLPLSLEAKVRKELQATLQQAGQAVNFGQELVQQIIDKYLSASANLGEVDLKSIVKQETGTFGFKTKESEAPSQSSQQSQPENQDWF